LKILKNIFPRMSTLVMKFGGASVASPDHFARIASIISTRSQHYKRLVVVVSAMGKTTDALIGLAHQVHPSPPTRELDMLISTGERVSIALLAMALVRIGKEAISFTGSQSGIITTPNHSEARIIQLKPDRLLPELDKGKVVIVAGFQGVSRLGQITTLGRGGSDTSAVALGAALSADKVEFFKDVGGIFSSDPKSDPEAELHTLLSYEEAIAIAQKGAKVLHLRALLLGQKNRLRLHVRSFERPDEGGTQIELLEERLYAKPVYEEVE
jgi:aspartate kinase